MKKQKYLIITLLLSFMVGIIVGLVEIFIENYSFSNLKTLIFDGCIGLLIGVILRYAFILINYKFRKKSFLSYIVSFFVIAFISMLPSILVYLTQGITVLRIEVLGIFLTAEILGMGLAYGTNSYYKKLNENLQIKKRKYDFQ